MKREKDLTKNTLILFLGTFYTKAAQYLLLPFYTRVLTTEEYGTIELLNTLVLLLVPVLTLQLEQGVFRYLVDSRKNKKEKKKLISTSVITVFGLNAICAILTLVLSPLIQTEYKGLLVANVVMNCFSVLFMQISRGLGSNKGYSISGVISATATMLLNVLFLLGLHLNVVGMLYGSLAGLAIGIIYLILKLRLYEYISIKEFSAASLKKMLKYSLPMLPNALAWWVFSSSDRLIVSGMLGLSENGLLSVAYKFSSLLIIVYNVFHMSFVESAILSKKDKDFESYYNKVFTIISQLFVSCGGIFIAVMALAFNILVGEGYGGAYGLLPIAILATIFQVFAGLLVVIYIIHDNTKSIAATSVIAAIINVIVDFLLINFVGVYAAVISTVCSFAFLFIYRLFDVNRRYLKVKLDFKLLANLLITFVVTISMFYVNNIYLNIVSVVMAVVLAIIFNKNNIEFVLKLLKKKRLKN